ncbi:hypothetical protein BDR26DRAFT_853102, partial [Obelidium mucronatum]
MQHARNSDAFFGNLDIPPPGKGGTPELLELYFLRRAFEVSVVNPFAPPSDDRETLMNYKDLPLTQFRNKISKLCPRVWFLSPTMFFYDHHYELGKCLIHEKSLSHTASIQGKPRLKIYHRFSLYRATMRGLIFTIVCIASLIYLGVYYSSYDFQKGGVKSLVHCTVSVLSFENGIYSFNYTYQGQAYNTTNYTNALALVASELGCVSWATLSLPPFLSTLICLVGMIILSLYTERHQLPKRGILRYLRQLGQPLVEEVMFSYSWQDGLSQDVRCLAKALIMSGIGVWIDVLKLTTGDKTSRTTRTVACHARFVVIVLSAQYLMSPNCFVEIYEALNTEEATKRVVFYFPDPKLYAASGNVGGESQERLLRLVAKMSDKGFVVLKKLPDLVDFFNRNVIYSVDRSHFVWWQTYVGTGFGAVEDAVPPDVKRSSALRKFNAKLLMLPTFKCQGNKNVWRNELPFRFKRGLLLYKKRVKISNVWISGDLLETGQNASAFPWPLALFICLLALPFVDLFYNIGSGSNLMAAVTQNTAPITFIAFGFGLALFAGLLDLGDMVDRRNLMNYSLKPLVATNNFSTSKKAPKRWVGQHNPRWARAESLQQVHLEENIDFVSQYSIRERSDRFRGVVTPAVEKKEETATEIKSTPSLLTARVKIAVHDFETQHIISHNLRHFLKNLDILQPVSDKEYDCKESIVVHVFIFGGGIKKDELLDAQEKRVREQVEQFNQFLVQYGLKVDDCVLVGSNSSNELHEIPGLFSAELKLPTDQGHVETSTMGSYLILLGSRLGKSFAEEVLLQTGLRVKNALKRYAKGLESFV